MLKQKLHCLLSFFSLLIAMPLYLTYKTLSIMVGIDHIFIGTSQLLSLAPGFLGILLRRGFYFLALKECSLATSIDFGTFFSDYNVSIGRNVYIGANCIISSCIIEDDVLVGSCVHIANKKRHKSDSLDKPIRLQGGARLQIRIGRESWIGNKAILMADIGSQSIVGAGSVVTNPVHKMSVVAGNPAREIRKRDMNL